DANADVLRLAMRWFYLQRSGVDLEDSVTGLHHRADHTTPAVLWDADGVHPERTFDVSGGWWDAGDFGRYVSPAATTLMSLFYAYRFNPDAFADGSLNIPESGNGVPDLLDEARWELEWLLKMQRADGAVHHKATTAHFTGWVMPEDDAQPIYVFDVSTQATGQFAGVMAEASIVYRNIDPQFADQLLEAARRAWGWLGANPDQYPPGGFRNPGDIETGEYSAGADEVRFRLWAAASLLHATGEQTYADSFAELWPQRATWRQVYGLYWPDGYAFAMVAYLDSPKGDDAIKTEIRQVIAEQSKAILNVINSTGYSVALRGNSDEFGYTWGSHCVMLNYATYLLLANEVAPGQKLVDGAAAQLNWILGANSLNKAFITGAGGNPIRTLHHAMSVASGITFPGAIGEGPNAMSIGGDPVLQAMFDADVPFSKR
ncbi:MAG: glycoside hydrolase family 9 protein, partial [Chloroflexota bacterium]